MWRPVLLADPNGTGQLSAWVRSLENDLVLCPVPRANAGDGLWGERIPDSPTLKARRELAARQPFTWDASGNVLCFFCQHPTPDACDLADPTTWAVLLYHAPDCPWLRAQEDHPRG